MKRRPISLLHLAKSGLRVHPYTLQNSSGCFCPLSHHHTSNPATGSHARSCHHTASHVSQIMLYALDHELLHTFFFPSFWYRLILISAIQRMLFQKWSGFFRCRHGSWVRVLIPLCVLCVLCGCLLLLATLLPTLTCSQSRCLYLGHSYTVLCQFVVSLTLSCSFLDF